MAQTSSISFRLAPDKAQRLDALAKATDRPRSWLLEQAVDAYLDHQAWQIGEIKKGLADIRDGNTIAHEDVAGWLESWGCDEERDPPR